ncbi:hypothetical protein J3459_014938 [Metarhizium acridum]|uniref:uncharacterized protein n=1 Tax=Metarhizium acridum TaxID=92637 RepID=UPI001C6C38BC|nr:hypothetical protein J3458_011605 [Metarhizium acridum]KAG8414212.1 hypothetical protein J3459_014938 [Metarhizium acridum]
MCAWQLSASERSTHLNGWRGVPKLRQRLAAFLASGGVDKVLSNVPEQKPTMVHADLYFEGLLGWIREEKAIQDLGLKWPELRCVPGMNIVPGDGYAKKAN